MRTRRICSADRKSLKGRIQRRGMRFYSVASLAVSDSFSGASSSDHNGLTKGGMK